MKMSRFIYALSLTLACLSTCSAATEPVKSSEPSNVEAGDIIVDTEYHSIASLGKEDDAGLLCITIKVSATHRSGATKKYIITSKSPIPTSGFTNKLTGAWALRLIRQLNDKADKTGSYADSVEFENTDALIHILNDLQDMELLCLFCGEQKKQPVFPMESECTHSSCKACISKILATLRSSLGYAEGFYCLRCGKLQNGWYEKYKGL